MVNGFVKIHLNKYFLIYYMNDNIIYILGIIGSIGIAFSWIGVGCLYPSAETALHNFALRPSSLNEMEICFFLEISMLKIQRKIVIINTLILVFWSSIRFYKVRNFCNKFSLST